MWGVGLAREGERLSSNLEMTVETKNLQVHLRGLLSADWHHHLNICHRKEAITTIDRALIPILIHLRDQLNNVAFFE